MSGRVKLTMTARDVNGRMLSRYDYDVREGASGVYMMRVPSLAPGATLADEAIIEFAISGSDLVERIERLERWAFEN